jgi:DNA-binding response OmpR family regulator
MLKKEGFMVDYYTDAGNALFHFRPEYYHLVILD